MLDGNDYVIKNGFIARLFLAKKNGLSSPAMTRFFHQKEWVTRFFTKKTGYGIFFCTGGMHQGNFHLWP